MRFLWALLIAAAFHAALGALLAFYLGRSFGPDVSATLEVSSVELSISENANDVAKPAVSMPSAGEPPQVRKLESPAPDKPDAQLAGLPPLITPPAVPRADVLAPAPMEPFRNPAESAKADAAPEEPEKPHDSSSVINAADLAPDSARVDVMPKLRRPIRPKYPRASRERGEEGSVRLRLGINAEGAVESAEILVSTGFKLLDAAAVKAVKAARFIPARSEGKPVFSTAEIKLEFKLN